MLQGHLIKKVLSAVQNNTQREKKCVHPNSKFRKQLRHIQKHSRIFLNIKWLYWTSLYVFRKVKNIFFRLKITFKPCNLLVLSNGPTRVCKYDENCNNNYSKWPTAKLVYQKIAAHLPVAINSIEFVF